MPSNCLIPCCPLLLLPSIFPSIRVFSNESAHHIRWPEYWSFSFNISPSNEHPGLIFRTDWLDLLAVQGTLRVFFNTTVQKHQFFSTQPFLLSNSHPYMTTGKTIALTRWTFVGKVLSLLFNILSRFVITFLPRSKHLLFHGCSHYLQWFWGIWKESLSLFPLFPPSICHEVTGPDYSSFAQFFKIRFFLLLLLSYMSF